MTTESVEQLRAEIDTSSKALADIKLRALKACASIDTTDTFKKRLRERIAAGEYAMRSALDDLRTSLAAGTYIE